MEKSSGVCVFLPRFRGERDGIEACGGGVCPVPSVDEAVVCRRHFDQHCRLGRCGAAACSFRAAEVLVLGLRVTWAHGRGRLLFLPRDLYVVLCALMPRKLWYNDPVPVCCAACLSALLNCLAVQQHPAFKFELHPGFRMPGVITNGTHATPCLFTFSFPSCLPYSSSNMVLFHDGVSGDRLLVLFHHSVI